MENWFYVRCSRGEGWPLASTLSVFQFEAFSHYAVVEGTTTTVPSVLLLLSVAAGIWSRSTWCVGSGHSVKARLWAQLPKGTFMVLIGRF